MKITFKNTLFATTAIVGLAIAGTAIAPTQAFAQAFEDTNNNGTIEAGEVTQLGASTAATIASDLIYDASDELVAEGDITVGESTTSAAAITANGDGSTFLISTDNSDATTTITIDGDITLATGTTETTLNITAAIDNNATAEPLIVDINGNVNIGTGTLTITADTTQDDNAASALVSGNITATEVALADDTTASASLTLDGTAAQAVNANITGDGDITVDNAAGATFNGTVTAGTVNIQKTTGNSSATFTDTVDVTGSTITLGGDASATDVNTVTFNGTGGSFTVTGEIVGANGTETNNIAITGGETISFAGSASETNLSSVSITGSSTLATNQDLTVTAATIEAGSTLATTANTITTDATLATGATLLLNGGDFTGDVLGTGILDVDSSATITGEVAATSANIAASADLEIVTGDYVVGTTTFAAADSELSITAGTNITGNLVAADASFGVIDITDAADTTVIDGNVGASGAAFDTLTVTDTNAAAVIETTGNLWVDAITLGEADSLEFTSASGSQAVSGTIVSANEAGAGIVVGTGTSTNTVTFNGVIGGDDLIDTFSVDAGATAIFNADATFDGNLTIVGTARINEGDTLTGADVVAGASEGSLQIVIGTATGADNSGTLADTGGAIDWADLNGANDAANITLRLGSGVIADNQEFLIVDGANTVATFVNDVAITDNSALYTFVVQDGDTAVAATGDTDIYAVASRVNLTTATANSANANALEGLLAVTAVEYDADAQLAAVYDAVQGASDLDEAAESIQATVDGGHILAANTFTSSTVGLNDQRLAALRSGETGMTAGNMGYDGIGMWGQAFGKTGEQDQRDGIDGFDIDTYGLAVGIDSENVFENGVVGLAFGYGDTNVDSENANATETDIDTYQLSLYGDFDLDERTFISGTAYYAYHDVETTRTNVGLAGLVTSGDFDSNQFGLNLKAGRDYAYEGAIVTPSVLANWSHYDGDDYVETGAGGASLDVNQESVSVFELGLGLDAKWSLAQSNGAVLEPTLSAGYKYDFIGDEVETTSSFTGGGASFETEGFDPAQSTFNIGAGATYFATDGWEFTADYGYEFKEDYDSHAGFLRAGYQF